MTEYVCPRDRAVLRQSRETLVCAAGHEYPLVDGIPVLLDPDAAPTQPEYWATRSESLPRDELAQPQGDEVDQYVRWAVEGTCGNLWGRRELTRYPIPTMPLSGPGRLLDVGSSWGRWSVAAARAGFDVTAIDPGLGAVRAARRVARQLGVAIEVAVGDARSLPVPDGSVDVVFSYSVLQHFDPVDVAKAVGEFARVLRPGGISLHQLPNRRGLLNVVRQSQRGFRPARAFEVRYWGARELETLFLRTVGPTTLSADAYLTLNPHAEDLSDLSLAGRALVRVSRALTQVSGRLPGLRLVADSLWVHSVRSAT